MWDERSIEFGSFFFAKGLWSVTFPSGRARSVSLVSCLPRLVASDRERVGEPNNKDEIYDHARRTTDGRRARAFLFREGGIGTFRLGEHARRCAVSTQKGMTSRSIPVAGSTRNPL